MIRLLGGITYFKEKVYFVSFGVGRELNGRQRWNVYKRIMSTWGGDYRKWTCRSGGAGPCGTAGWLAFTTPLSLSHFRRACASVSLSVHSRISLEFVVIFFSFYNKSAVNTPTILLKVSTSSSPKRFNDVFNFYPIL